MYKIRTMYQDSESLGTGLFSFANDPRITPVGHLLRISSLDELPQLFNVLNGSMSLVGPRPPVTYELGPVGDFSPQLLDRFSVKPGITGLAQISGRNHLNWNQKLNYDLKYIKLYARYGVLIDLFILLITPCVLLFKRNTIELPQI